MFDNLNHAGAASPLTMSWVAVTVIVSFPPDDRVHWSRPPSCGSASVLSANATESGSSASAEPEFGSPTRQALQVVAVPG